MAEDSSPFEDREAAPGDGGQGIHERPYWNWLPTNNGAVRRDLVRSFRVSSIDGDFDGGARRAWTVTVDLDGDDEPVTLRPLFLHVDLLVEWVDKVFPGAAFQLLPPHDVADQGFAEHPEATAGAAGADVAGGVRLATSRGSAANIAGAIRQIGDGLAGGNGYEPFAGQRGGAAHMGGQIG